MNYLKIQQHILKLRMQNKPEKLMWSENDDYTIIVANYWAAYIPKEFCFLDAEKLCGTEKINVAEFTKFQYTEAFKKSNMTVEYQGSKLVIFEHEDTKVYINEKYLKLFDTPNAEYCGSNHKSPICILEDGNLIGFVLPVNYKGGD